MVLKDAKEVCWAVAGSWVQQVEGTKITIAQGTFAVYCKQGEDVAADRIELREEILVLAVIPGKSGEARPPDCPSTLRKCATNGKTGYHTRNG
jgi:hypothetical protein